MADIENNNYNFNVNVQNPTLPPKKPRKKGAKRQKTATEIVTKVPIRFKNDLK